MSNQDYTFILAGRFGVGKTSIFRRIQTEEFSEQPTLLLDTGPRSGGSDTELEHQVYKATINNMTYNVSHNYNRQQGLFRILQIIHKLSIDCKVLIVLLIQLHLQMLPIEHAIFSFGLL